MELTIKTDIFKEMVSRSIKGASQNKLIPLTGLMAIQLKDNCLTLVTTDATNYLYIKQDNVVGDEFYVVVQTEQFSKLIGKLTCETITLVVNDNVLVVKGNGEYKIEIPMDEEGNNIVFPDPASNTEDFTYSKTVKLATIKMILNTIKPSLAVTMEIPVYTRYYIGERVIATDTFKMASVGIDLFNTEPMLISAEMMNLMDVMTCEDVKFSRKDNILLFETPDCIVYGYAMEGVEDYQVDAITTLINEEFKSKCKLDRNALLCILDRLSLFVSKYDNKAVVLTFTEAGVDISSKTNSGVETLTYIESENFEPFTCQVDIEMLTTQLKAKVGDTFNLQYGSDRNLKIADGNLTQIIALLEE